MTVNAFLLPPEQKARGSNPLGRARYTKELRQFRSSFFIGFLKIPQRIPQQWETIVY
jgi:hypothetical protein